MKPETKATTKCTICPSSRRQKIEDAIGSGLPRDQVIARFGLARAGYDRHRAHMGNGSRAERAAIAPPAPPQLGSDATPQELARAQCVWLNERQQWLHATGASEHQLGRAVAQYSAAIRTLSKLAADDEREPSEEQLTKSSTWKNILARLEPALRPFPEAARAMLDALRGLP